MGKRRWTKDQERGEGGKVLSANEGAVCAAGKRRSGIRKKRRRGLAGVDRNESAQGNMTRAANEGERSEEGATE